VKGAHLARRARTETTAATKKLTAAPAILASGLAKLRKGKAGMQKRLASLRTQGTRWLKKYPGRAVVGAFALGVTVTKVGRRL
jgi:hypothetical protein